MAIVRVLVGWNVDVVSRRTIDDETGDVVTVYALVFTEKGTGNVIRFEHGDEVKEHILKGYTGGIQIAGELPSG